MLRTSDKGPDSESLILSYEQGDLFRLYLGRLARRPKVLRRLARRRYFSNIYIRAAGKVFDNLMDLIIRSWG